MRLITIGASFLVGLGLMAAKFYIYRITHSSAIFSDALESIINVVAAAFAFGSVVLAAKPPDESHPYGHGKAEYFSAGFEGALIILAALGIFRAGISHLLHPRPLHQLDTGLLMLLATGIVNLGLGIILMRIGRRTDSFAIVADGKHILTDVYTSAGVLLGLFLVSLTGWYWLDGTIACLVGVHILITGGSLVHKSVSRLMDESDPDLLEEIAVLLRRFRKPEWIDVHDLRAWRSGRLIHVDFHLVLPYWYSLKAAHQEAREIEDHIRQHFRDSVEVLVHMDPCRDKTCPYCEYNVCHARSAALQQCHAWTRQKLTENNNRNHLPAGKPVDSTSDTGKDPSDHET
ncbi:MAG TPA: cation diffusion facilitator family transporter [Tichowtungia sp.]|nr:cation diffusion facilitator family transporter [Tichowtungia sp.]